MLRFLKISFAAVSVVTLVGTGCPARADVVLLTSAFSDGKNGAEFHTDVRVFNPSPTSPVLVTPVFYQSDANGFVVDTVTKPAFTIGPREQVAYDNILSSLFGLTKGFFGPIRFEANSPVLVSSGTNNYKSCGNTTPGASIAGQWIPGIDVGQALKAGTLVQLAASADSATGYRTNVDFINPSLTTGANVTIKIRKGDGTQLSSNTINLDANGLFQKAIDDGGAFPEVAGTTDTNLWLEFTSDQPVLSFASVINNASGDPFAVTAAAELPAPVAAPVAAYTVSATPTAGVAATFTDTSSNSPVNRFWTFGDGASLGAGDATTAQHTYSAAGTYHTSLVVGNAGGASSALKDVTVAAPAPIVFNVTATTTGDTHWTFNPNSITCKVGVQCKITWSTPASENKTHGIGGLAVLGITQCDFIQPILPCTATFTPTTGMLNGQPPGGYVYACTKTECAPTQAQHDGMTGIIVIVP
jgi:PKD repeat protein